MKNLPITFKVALSFTLVVLMFVLVVLTTTRNISRLENNTEIMHLSQKIIAEIATVVGEVKDAEIGERGYLITGDDAYLDPYTKASKTIFEDLDQLKILTSEKPEYHKGIVQVEGLLAQRFEGLEKVLELRRAADFEAAQELFFLNASHEIMAEIYNELEAISASELELLVERELLFIAALKKAKKGIVLMLFVVLFIVAISLLFLNNLVVQPLGRLSSKAKEIARGNLNNDFNADNRKDEIGVLARSFKIMQDNLQIKAKQAGEIANGNFTVDVTPLSDQDVFGRAFSDMVKMFNHQMNEIQGGVNVLSTASNEMMAVMSQLATASSQTATSVSETTSTIEEIKQTTEVSSQKATEVTESSKKLAQVSRTGNDSVQNSINGMNKIKQQMESIAAIVIQLSDRSHKIGEIANTVNDIAEQSNLLAVNASIEASKAGEQGRGFAVVAQEIKNLASRSKASTVEIRTILNDIQKEISSAVMATEQGAKVIDEGLVQSSKASEIISILASNAEDTLQANMLISATSEQQLVGMEQIALAMENIKDASVQNSNSTRQAEISVSELKDLGASLMDLLERYQLKES